MIMPCCSSTSFHPPNTLFPSKSFSKALCSAHAAIPPAPKSQFTLPSWKTPPTSGTSVGDDRRRRLYDSFLYLEHMVSKGHAPDPAQFAEFIHALCSFRNYGKAVRAMELFAAATGRTPDRPALILLLNRLCRCGNVEHALQLLGKMESVGLKPDFLICRALLRGLCTHRNLSQGVKFLKWMRRRGLVPDQTTVGHLIEAVYKERGLDEAERLLKGIMASGGQRDLIGYNMLLTRLCIEGRLDDAMRLLQSPPSKRFLPNKVSYNILLCGLYQNGQWAKADKLQAEMRRRGYSISVDGYPFLVCSLAVHGRTAYALEMLDEMVVKGFRPKAKCYNSIIARFCKDGDVAAAKDCLDLMINRHHVAPDGGTCNAVALLCKNPPGLVHEAFDMIQTLYNHQQDLAAHGFCRRVVSQLCYGGNTLAAIQLLPEMTRIGVMPVSETYSSLIHGLFNEDMLDAAVEVMGVMEDEGIVTEDGTSSSPTMHNYNSFVIRLCETRKTDLALGVYERIVERGLMPDEATYSTLVQGIAREAGMKLAAEVLMELHRRDAVDKTTVQKIATRLDMEELVDCH